MKYKYKITNLENQKSKWYELQTEYKDSILGKQIKYKQ
jgi:hypothetical protein